MNLIHIAGHLGADAEVRYTSTGKKVINLRVATRTRKRGVDDTIWWRVTLWGDQYDKMVPYLKKGSSVIVVGEMQKPEIFNDKEGRPQISLDVTAVHIQFSPFGRAGSGGQEGQASQEQSAPFGQTHAGAASPYAGSSFPGTHAKEEGEFQGQTFDDEVPF